MNHVVPHKSGAPGFSPDGRRLLSAGTNGGVALWDVETGRRLATTVWSGPDSWVVFTPDGRFDGAGQSLREVYWVDNHRAIPLDALYERFFTPNLLARAWGDVGLLPAPPSADKKLTPPPRVRFVAPTDGAQVDDATLEVVVQADDQGGVYYQILQYHNGKLVEGTQRGFKRTGTRSRFPVAPMPGLNELQAVALNAQRIESEPAVVRVMRKAPASQPRLFVVAVGINRYKNATLNLNYGQPDAAALVAALEQRSRAIFAEIVTHEIYEERATRAGINRAIEAVIASSSPADAFVFYYAGHGVMSEGEAATPAEFYLVPHDVTQLYGRDDLLQQRGVAARQLQQWSRLLPPRKQLLLLDACQSAGALDKFALRGAAEQRAIAQLARSAGIVVLAASGTEPFAAEMKKLGHGVFTYALLQGLSGSADGSTRDRKITVKELEAFLNDAVPALTEEHRGAAQYPHSYSRGQDFPIAIH